MTVASKKNGSTPANNVIDNDKKLDKHLDEDKLNWINRKKEIHQKEEENNEEDDDDDINPEDLAPDGGFGWIIASAMILAFTSTISQIGTLPLLFGDFLEATGQAGSAMTILNSVTMISFSLAGLLSNVILKKYSMRSVGVVGALFFAIPNVILAFVQTFFEMAFMFFLQGIGLGLIITVCNTNFNAYFVKKRAQVMSASQVIVALSGIIYPIYIEKMMSIYGFRGTAAMTGALSLNSIVGMSLMHPVEWHARDLTEIRAEKRRERKEKKLKEKLINGKFNDGQTIDITHVVPKARWSSLRSLKDETVGKEVPLLIETLKASRGRVGSISEIEAGFRMRSKSGSARDYSSRRVSMVSASSLATLVNKVGIMGTETSLNNKHNQATQFEDTTRSNGMLSSIMDLFEITLLKNWSFLNICLGISFVFASDFTFASLLPLMMTHDGFSKSDAALAVTVGATAELVSRCLLAVFTLVVDIKAKYLFYFAMICMTFAKVGYLYYEDTLVGVLVFVAIIGGIRSWLIVPQPLAVVENISVDKYAAAYGMFAVISGIISTVFGPIVGFVKDWTNSFGICQWFLIGMQVLFIIPWTIDFVVVDLIRNREKKKAIVRS